MSAPEMIEEQPYGWVIVTVATVCLMLGFGANLSVTVLIEPLQAEFGWSRAELSGAYTMVTIGAAAGGLVWGGLSDRIGARRIGFLSCFVLSGSLIALGFQSNLHAIYALYLLIGGVGFAGLFTPMLALTGLWFSRRKGLALGIVTAGGAFGQGAVPFIERILISTFDWRTALAILGAGTFAVLFPCLFLLRPAPVLAANGTNGNRSDDNLWGVPHRISIAWLAAAGMFCCICMAVPLVHLVPLCLDMNLSPTVATSMLLSLMTAGVFGRVIFGHVADRIGGLHAYVVASFGQTAAVFWFTQITAVPGLYAMAVTFGFFFSGVMTCLLVCAREAAPLRMAGTATAIIGMSGWIGMGIGGFQAGYFYDRFGDYTISYANAAMAGIVNLLIVIGLIWFCYSWNQREPGVAPA